MNQFFWRKSWWFLPRLPELAMEQVNAVGYDTPRGYRIAELIHGDLTRLSPAVDVLVGSSFAGDCSPTGNSLIRGLAEQGIEVFRLFSEPAFDFRAALGVWVSAEQSGGPARRLLFVEMRGRALGLNEAIENVFGVLSLLEAKGVLISRVAMPLLGAGAQGYAPADVIEAVLPNVRSYLARSATCSVLSFVERNQEKVDALSNALDKELGRRGRTLSYSDLSRAVRKDVINRLMESADLFAGASDQRSEWLRMLHDDLVNPTLFGVNARKLVELFLVRLGLHKGHLADRIKQLREKKAIAPWICAYMDVLRHIGNDAVHSSEVGFDVNETDMVTALFCVERLLDSWISVGRDLVANPWSPETN